MSAYFVDTSALSKFYIQEDGSSWVRNELKPDIGNILLISEITTVEFCSTLARRRADKQLLPDEVSQYRFTFLAQVRQVYIIIPANTEVLRRARDLVDIHERLRTLDAIQLASAIMGRSSLNTSLVFVAADTRLLAIATAESFQVENPLNHP